MVKVHNVTISHAKRLLINGKLHAGPNALRFLIDETTDVYVNGIRLIFEPVDRRHGEPRRKITGRREGDAISVPAELIIHGTALVRDTGQGRENQQPGKNQRRTQ